MSRWVRDYRSLIDLAIMLVIFAALGGIMHLVTGRVVSATIAGAALGFLVSEGARWRRERTQDRWVRRALRLEFSHNLAALAAFWTSADVDSPLNADGLTPRQARFLHGVIPQWNRTLWSSQVGHIGSALSDDEISAALLMQSEYDRLMAVRERVLAHNADRASDAPVDPSDWSAISEIMHDLLERGNAVR